MKWLIILIVIIKSCTTQDSRGSADKGVNEKQVENWANEFGQMLFTLSSSVTKYNELQTRYQRSNGGGVHRPDLNALLNEILERVDKSNREKIDAVMKLVIDAENKALDFLDKKSKGDGWVESDGRGPKYFNAKSQNFTDEGLEGTLKLVDHPHFGTKVNTSRSTVHVPTSIYDKDEDVLEAISWSEYLDQSFTSNFKNDPTLSWQYFGSSTGFLRQYPGVKWKNTNEDEYDPDLYDCRLRPWYTNAANYPKNMVILYDVSGSMTGLRREIAKHVVSTILDTLTENDFVTVFNFTDDTQPLVPCFGDHLVQANLKNLREFKVALEQDRTAKVANFTTALLKAFDVLEKHRKPDTQESALCNQAIMIITDGAPYHYEEIFKARQDQEHFTRIFTYLIGREVTDKREVMWMACAHKGYFVHVTTLGEVQEQVLKYMPVMSRPMVMYGVHNVTWTSVYADINILSSDGDPRALVLKKDDLKRNKTTAVSPVMEFEDETEIERTPFLRELKKALKRKVPEQCDKCEVDEEKKKVDDGEVHRIKRYWNAIFYDFAKYKDIGESDWKWDKRNRGKQMERSERFKEFARIFQSDNRTLLEPFTVNASLIEGGRRSEDDIWIAKNRVSEFLDFGVLDASPEQRRAMYAERVRIEIPEYDERHPRAEPITQKKLEIRMKKHYEDKKKANRIKWPKEPTFNFMVSVSIPVFDLRNATVRPPTHEVKKKVNDTFTLEKIDQKRIANFLGVAGTDIHIKELIRMTSPFKLGVNGYAFAVTNNGHIIFHPDWRPILPEDILKPNYNAIDLSEIELVDNEHTFRNNDSDLLEMRRDMVNHLNGYRNLKIIFHQDTFRRVVVRRQKYEHAKMANTSYSLAISIPEKMFHFKGEIDTKTADASWDTVKAWFDASKEPGTRKWKLHPDWLYCEHIGPGVADLPRDTLENRIMSFIQKMTVAKQRGHNSSWSWSSLKKQDGLPYFCDRELVSALLFDANVTSHFANENLTPTDKSNLSQFIQMYGVHLAFLATRSGLTRWIGPLNKDRAISTTDAKFEDSNVRAIDELWYKRAVDRWYIDPESFVFSIPFDAGTRTDNLVTVTATRAIFVNGPGGSAAPVAVTGIQFDHARWREQFFGTTSKSLPGAKFAGHSCNSEINCYVLDDNGFVLISEITTDQGKFFGDIDGMVMDMLVKSDVYRRVNVVDFQATCFHPVSKSSPAGILETPLQAIKWLIHGFITSLAWFALNLNIHSLIAPDFTSVLANYVRDDTGTTIEDPIPYIDLASINKTRLRPCDQQYGLYAHGTQYRNSTKGKLTACGLSKCSGFFHVHYVPFTNLILVITDGTCRCPNVNTDTSIKPKEVIYQIQESVRNLSAENEIVAQICRTPAPEDSPPLYRNRMYNESQCRDYHAEEEPMKADCGLGVNLQPNNLFIILILACYKITVAIGF